MTCHGDVGQGLTDDFRAIWPEDPQNCWEHGCHGGPMDDEGFPIPTIVPPLVDAGKLEQFASQQVLYDFLKSTHPKILVVWRKSSIRPLSNMYTA